MNPILGAVVGAVAGVVVREASFASYDACWNKNYVEPKVTAAQNQALHFQQADQAFAAATRACAAQPENALRNIQYNWELTVAAFAVVGGIAAWYTRRHR